MGKDLGEELEVGGVAIFPSQPGDYSDRLLAAGLAGGGTHHKSISDRLLPGHCEPRAVKRRSKPIALLTVPRRQVRNQLTRKAIAA